MPQQFKVLPNKICLNCGKEFNRREMPNGRFQDAKLFQAQNFCSRICGNSRKEVKQTTLLWRARKFKKAACESCGYTKKLAVHHCDQNQANNDPTNLQTLCKHCHDFWHTTQKRVGLAVAGRMPQLIGGKPSLMLGGLQTELSIGFTASKDWVTPKSRSKQP